MSRPAEPDVPADPDTVRRLWEESARRLRAWFERRTGDAHDAEDLVQETFARVQARLGTLRESERVGAWVGKIAANVLADHGRRLRDRRAPAPTAGSSRAGLLAELSAADTSSEREADELRAAVAGWMEAFLAGLDPADERILREVDLGGRSQAEVARDLGLAPSSVRSRVQRARARSRRDLEACCSFAFDARGGLNAVRRRAASDCGCDGG